LQNDAPFYYCCYLHEGSAAENLIFSFRFPIGKTLITIEGVGGVNNPRAPE